MSTCPPPSEPSTMQFRVEGLQLFGAPADLALSCRRCPWAVHVAEPIMLADLIDRAEEHAEETHR